MRSQAESSRITLTTKEEDENEIKPVDDETDLELNRMEIYFLCKLEKIPRESYDSESSSVCAKIQKVPDHMRLEGGPDYYTPSVISVGPIHGTNEKLAQRYLKLRAAQNFAVNTRGSMKNLLILIKGDLDAIKKCYKKTAVEPFSDDELAILFFLDACFVMQFIDSTVNGTLNEFGISRGLQNSIQQDLFLFENQLPWRLLEILINFGKFMHLKDHICEFMAYNLISPVGTNKKERYLTNEKDRPPAHLLDLLREELLYTLPVDHGKNSSYERPGSQKCPRSFRNVQDLKTEGIKVRPSKTSTLSDVSFSSSWFFNATLRLPPLTVDSSTMTRLLNLVAYEMCPGNEGCDFGVSSYLWLMDLLVDTEQDVRDLRETHVLRNRYGSNSVVATLFNEIGSNLVVPTDAYRGLLAQIQKHYDRKLARWWAQFYEDYFSSPWKVVALMVGALVLFFSGVSAYFAAFPPQQGK